MRGTVVDIVARWRSDAVAVERIPSHERACVRAGPFLVEVDRGAVRVDGSPVHGPTHIAAGDDVTLDIALTQRDAAARDPFDIEPDTLRTWALGVGAVLALLVAIRVTPVPLADDALAEPLFPEQRERPRLVVRLLDMGGGSGDRTLSASLVSSASAPQRSSMSSAPPTRRPTPLPPAMFSAIERDDDGGALALAAVIEAFARREREGTREVAQLVDSISRLGSDLSAFQDDPGSGRGAPGNGAGGLCIKYTGEPKLAGIAPLLDDDDLTLPRLPLPHAPPKQPLVLPPAEHEFICTLPGGDGRDGVRRVVERAFTPLKACYEKGLATQPDLTGKLTLRWSIRADDGRVAAISVASSTLAEPAGTVVGACVTRVIRSLRFALPSGADDVEVSYPFVFAPGGD